MRRIAKEDLRYKSYTLKTRQMLSEIARTSRIVRLGSHSGLPIAHLNLLNYYIRSVVERVTNKSRHPNVMSLKTVIEAAFVGMDSATLQRACERFRSRIEAIIQANGGYIE